MSNVPQPEGAQLAAAVVFSWLFSLIAIIFTVLGELQHGLILSLPLAGGPLASTNTRDM